MIILEIDTDDITRALAEVVSLLRSDGANGLLDNISEQMVYQTEDRIEQGGPAPDGSLWAPKQQSTLDRYKMKGEGVDTRPLIHLGHLSGVGIFPYSGPGFAGVGVSARYGAAMQFGAKKGSFGDYSGVSAKTGRKYSGSAPWGDIPARPFIGLSDQNEVDILDSISEALARALE